MYNAHNVTMVLFSLVTFLNIFLDNKHSNNILSPKYKRYRKLDNSASKFWGGEKVVKQGNGKI